MVADVEVEGFQHVGIVQGGTVHHGAGEEDGIHVGNGSYHTRAPHLERDFSQDGACLFRLELVGNGPTGRLGRHAQSLLLGKGVHLDDNAVRGHGKFLAVHVPVTDVLPEFLQGVAKPHVLAHLKAPRTCRFHILIVPRGCYVFSKEIVQIGIKAALAHHLGVLALQCARCRIAGIGKEVFAGPTPLVIQSLETLPGHEHLATYLELLGDVFSGGIKHEGDRADGTNVGRNVVALHTVATGQGLHQFAVPVVQGDGKAVVLQFGTHLEGLAVKAVGDALVELAHLLQIVGICQGKHRAAVRHGAELVVQVAAHALGGGIGVRHIRILLLQVLQAVHHLVEFLVGDDGGIQHIIIIVMPVQLFPQAYDAFSFVHALLIYIAKVIKKEHTRPLYHEKVVILCPNKLRSTYRAKAQRPAMRDPKKEAWLKINSRAWE